MLPQPFFNDVQYENLFHHSKDRSSGSVMWPLGTEICLNEGCIIARPRRKNKCVQAQPNPSASFCARPGGRCLRASAARITAEQFYVFCKASGQSVWQTEIFRHPTQSATGRNQIYLEPMCQPPKNCIRNSCVAVQRMFSGAAVFASKEIVNVSAQN